MTYPTTARARRLRSRGRTRLGRGRARDPDRGERPSGWGRRHFSQVTELRRRGTNGGFRRLGFFEDSLGRSDLVSPLRYRATQILS